MLSLLPQLNPNPAVNTLYWVILYLIAGVYFIEQLFHPLRDGECPGEETNEKLIMLFCLMFWPVVVVSMFIGMVLISVYRFFRGLGKLISRFFSS